jgi:thymidylate kinase
MLTYTKTTTPPISTVGDALLVFTSRLYHLGIPYVILGDTTNYPHKINSDIDIALSLRDHKDCVQLVKQFANENKLKLVQLLKHEICAYYFVLSWRDGNNQSNFIALDICVNYYRDGKPFIKIKQLVADRRLAESKNGDLKDFYVPSPEMEFLYYLIKKIEKGKINSIQFKHLQEQFDQCPDKCVKKIENILCHEDALKIASWIKNDILQKMSDNLPKLKQNLIQKARRSFTDQWFEFWRKIYRITQPTGVVICLLGPDGSGKSTIGHLIKKEIAPVFRGHSYIHLKPNLLRQSNSKKRKPVTDPHGGKNRNIFTSTLKLLYFIFDYILGYWIKIYPLKATSHLILFDRYYYDLLIDPKRFRYGGFKWLAHLSKKVIPEPDITILFDATAEVLQSRKQEVSFKETVRQRKEYLEFTKRLNKTVLIIDSEESVNDVCKKTIELISIYMETRLSKRIRLNK